MKDKNESMDLIKDVTPSEAIAYYEVTNAVLTKVSDDAIKWMHKYRKKYRILLVCFTGYVIYEKKLISKVRKFFTDLDNEIQNK